ncbi:MAG: FAD-dependent oxidoreductase [Oligoflexia bacterium]|nr:FAD-dependent oxidoreductase [Oligoflexia bacterium]
MTEQKTENHTHTFKYKSDKMYPLDIVTLFKMIFAEYENYKTIFGISANSFFSAKKFSKIKLERFSKTLDSPLGVAAGPHTQLSQNIIAAWLVGCRFIELKTIQTLDELEVSKPCIDMEDAGFNCEWSQELKLNQSFDEYLNAWIMIHILKDKFEGSSPNSKSKSKSNSNSNSNSNLKWNLDNHHKNFGTIFNMSVGYNLQGIMNENVQTFLKKMRNASSEIEEAKQKLKKMYPQILKLAIPSTISDNITLSTMHGCPPDEIEKIGLYLIRDEKFHTTIKLNPTLNGAKDLREILNKKLGHDTINVPDIAFEHDLKYKDAIKIIKNLKKESEKQKLHFSIKFTNTLEVVNNRNIFDKSNQMMYMSGRSLHALSMNIASKIQKEFDGKLDLTLSGGIDAFNACEVLATNIRPLTVCSDLLKPGGYQRLGQYFENIKKGMNKCKAQNLDDLVLKNAKIKILSKATLKNLKDYNNRIFSIKETKNFKDKDAASTINATILKAIEAPSRYHKEAFPWTNIKTQRPLSAFDCIEAPCKDTCPAHQMIPLYMYLTSKGEWQKALEVIRLTNPFPNSTGMACDHNCENKCTRINYDNPLRIREIKRFLAMKEKESNKNNKKSTNHKSNNINNKIKIKIKEIDKSVAIIGGGPSGLSAAYYLRLAGLKVHVFEKKPTAGGMLAYALPNFRTIPTRVQHDIERIKSLGVVINQNSELTNIEDFKQLQDKFDYIYVAVGASKAKKLNLPGEEILLTSTSTSTSISEINTNAHQVGLIDFLSFLELVKWNKIKKLPKKVVVIGGGNSAIDAARSAKRLVGPQGKVDIIYRRSTKEMPADREEIHELTNEKINVIELTLPNKIISKKGKVVALECVKMNLTNEMDKSGRAISKIIEGSNFNIKADYIINAIGQETSLNFLPPNFDVNKVLMGGDVVRGPSSIIKGIADGFNTALTIAAKEQVADFFQNLSSIVEDYSIHKKNINIDELRFKKSTRAYGIPVPKIELKKRKGFDVVIKNLSDKEAKLESERCLYCDNLCDVCVSVCPNRANFSYEIKNFPQQFLIKDIILKNGELSYGESYDWTINQRYQTANISNFCNECGNCATFCPTAGKPYMDKPKICLTTEAYDQLSDNVFYFISQNKNKNKVNEEEGKNGNIIPALKAKFNGVEYSLIDNPLSKTLNIIIYESREINIKIEFDRKNFTFHNVSLVNSHPDFHRSTSTSSLSNLSISSKDLYKMILLYKSLPVHVGM